VTRVRESEKGRERVRRKAVFVFVGRDRGGSRKNYRGRASNRHEA